MTWCGQKRVSASLVESRAAMLVAVAAAQEARQPASRPVSSGPVHIVSISRYNNNNDRVCLHKDTIEAFESYHMARNEWLLLCRNQKATTDMIRI